MSVKSLVLLFLLIPIVVGAQINPTATPTSKFNWDQVSPDLATASSYTYKYYLDGSINPVIFSGVTCVATPTAMTFTCTVLIPAMAAGNHTVQFTATNTAGESVKSIPFAFVFVNVPVAPANIRLT